MRERAKQILTWPLRAALGGGAALARAAFPIGIRGDLLYLWATFRLRRRPVKMLALLVMLGLFCWVWEWMGRHYAAPWLARRASQLPPNRFREILIETSYAIFSTLNVLSCAGVVIIARSLRKLTHEGHIESLMLTPNRIRPSSLFYAIGLRYLPLAFIAILVLYLDPRSSPFSRPPYVLPPGEEMSPNPWVLRWAILQELSVLTYCPTNLMMDLVLGYWIFSRIRLSNVTVIGAVVAVGLVEPVILMSIRQWIEESYLRANLPVSGAGIMLTPQGRPVWIMSSNMLPYYTYMNIVGARHYFLNAGASLILGWIALADLDLRWARLLRSPKRDPVLFRRVD